MTDPNSSSDGNDSERAGSGGSSSEVGPRLPDDPFVRFDARVLDPTTAVRLPDGVAPSATAYRGDRLLITAPDRARAEQLIALLDAAAADLGLAVAGPDPFVEIERDGEGRVDVNGHNAFARLLGLAEQTATPLVVPVRLVSSSTDPAPAVDAWPVLQRIKATAQQDDAAAIGLDHLMYAAANIGGNPFTARGSAMIGGNPFTARGSSVIGGNPFTARGSAAGAETYLYAGSGGHGPVSVVMAEPRPTGGACPRVVVMDTGVGEHPWFVDRPVHRTMTVSTGDHVGMDVHLAAAIDSDPEGRGSIPDPMTGELASHAGHGTFIAGLLRQTCPDADITVLRIMDADGIVPESALTTAMMGFGIKLAEDPGRADALVLSLGYYPETPEDQHYTCGLRDQLLTIAARGAAIFAAAGNDSTEQRSYPAAFADDPAFDQVLPLIAVAALNPDHSVALFSNDGPWVQGAAAGANVVSTAPVRAQGAYQPGVSLIGPDGRRRATIDPDDFSSGFATWSGTSFAAPILAGRYLRHLGRKDLPQDVSERRSLVPVRRT